MFQKCDLAHITPDRLLFGAGNTVWREENQTSNTYNYRKEGACPGARLDSLAMSTPPANTQPGGNRDDRPSVNPRPRLEAALAAALERCAVVDLETTGLEPATDRVIEIAVLTVEHGSIVGRFHCLLNPERSIPAESSNINGLRDDDVANSPTFAEVAQDLLPHVLNRTLVGHNVKFDVGFLAAEYARLGHADAARALQEQCLPQALCTAATARELIPREAVGRYTLANLAAHCGLPSSPAHRAQQDAATTFDLTHRLYTIAQEPPQR